MGRRVKSTMEKVEASINGDEKRAVVIFYAVAGVSGYSCHALIEGGLIGQPAVDEIMGAVERFFRKCPAMKADLVFHISYD